MKKRSEEGSWSLSEEKWGLFLAMVYGMEKDA